VLTRTGDLESCILADDASFRFRIRCVAVVDADVRPSVLVVYDAQEEQLTTRQQHPVRRRVLVGRHNRNSVAIPRDEWRWFALCLAIERRRFVFGYELVFRVFDDAWVRRLVARRLFDQTCIQYAQVSLNNV